MSLYRKPQDGCSSPFLVRFSGKVGKIDKSGTLGAQSAAISLLACKSKTAFIRVEAENFVENNDVIRKTSEVRLQKPSKLKPLTQIAPVCHSEETERHKSGLYIQTILPEHVSASMDFQQMLNKLTSIETNRKNRQS